MLRLVSVEAGLESLIEGAWDGVEDGEEAEFTS